MFKLFQKKDKSNSKALEYAQSQRRENLEDFILILTQIQKINNEPASGKGSFFKNYKTKQLHIDNVVSLSIEQMQEKIMELG